MNKVEKNVHAIVSLFIAGISLGIAAISIGTYSINMLLVYLLIIGVSAVIITGTYCVKCSGRDSCAHVIPGKISKMISKYNPGKYTAADWIAVIIPIALIAGFPQIWLVKRTALLVTFWILLLIAGLEVLIFVCNKCSNDKCCMCRRKLIIAG